MNPIFDRDGYCKILNDDSEVVFSFQTIYSLGFNNQYSTPISDSKLYIGNWENGLYCYEIKSGNLLWKKGPGKVRQIEVFKDFLFIEMCDRGIYKRNKETGELLEMEKISAIESFYRISGDEIIAGPKYNKYSIFRLPELSISYEIPLKNLNYNNSLSFIIQKCIKLDSTLLLNGWEEYPERDYSKKGNTKFERKISLEPYRVAV